MKSVERKPSDALNSKTSTETVAKKEQKMKGLFLTILVLFFVLSLFGAYYSYTFFYKMESNHIPMLEALTVRQRATSTPGGDEEETLDTQIFNEVLDGAVAPATWNGSDRVTMLIMGLDLRDIQAGVDYGRTDTMIVMSLDPVNKTAGIISVPRDLWVIIPGFTANKINSAYTYGEGYNLPGGGAELAMRTVEKVIGVPIDYYAIVDFDAFIRFIDLIGGVKLDIKEPIKVDPLGPKDPRTLQPGVQTLPGDIALAYARDRYSGGGDFARSERQQQVIMGIFERIVSFELLPVLISNANSIYGTLADGIDTNLPLEDAIKLARSAITVDSENIRMGVIGESQITYGNSPDNLSILIPQPDKIRTLRDEIFAIESPYKPMTEGGIDEKMVAEQASVHLVDATANPDGFARTVENLKSLGMNVTATSSNDYALNNSSITDFSGNPYTSTYLVNLFGVNAQRIYFDYQPDNGIDVQLVIGMDWNSINPFQ